MQERQYVLKYEQRKKIKELKTNREIADILGVTEPYISQIMNQKKTRISKLMAYGFCKAISPDLEINDIFNIF